MYMWLSLTRLSLLKGSHRVPHFYFGKETVALLEKIAIIHSELQEGELLLLKNYFSMCGVSVHDYSVTSESGFDLNYDFDAVFLVVTESKNRNFMLNGKQRELAEKKYPDIISIEGLELDWNQEEQVEKQLRKEFINNCLNTMMERHKGLINSNEKSDLDLISEIYVKHDIMKNNIILHTFLGFPNFIRATRKSLINAYIELVEGYNEHRTSNYYWYALRHLERLINEACDFLGVDNLFDAKQASDNLIKTAEKQAENCNVFKSKIYGTAARFRECNMFHREECVEMYEKAKKYAESTAFDYKSFYWYGRSIEKHENNWSKAIGFFREAAEKNPGSYKARYKLGIYEWKQNASIWRACSEFRKIDTILSRKYENRMLLPIEAEYLYKTWYFIGVLVELDAREVPVGITRNFVEDRKKLIVDCVRDIQKRNINYQVIFGKNCDIKSIDGNSERLLDARAALAERIQVVCKL